MELIADMPIGIGEPHYTQIIKADKLKALEIYPPGTDPLTMAAEPVRHRGRRREGGAQRQHGRGLDVGASAATSRRTSCA